MCPEIEILAPVSTVGQLLVRKVAIHPLVAIGTVVVGKRKVRSRVAQGLTDGHALSVQSCRHAPDRGLSSLVVDVPMVEVFDRPGIHDDERRMDDRPGVHQRRRQRILDRLDRVRKGLGDTRDSMIAQASRKDAGGKPRGPRRDRDLVDSVLATEPGKGSGLADGHIRFAARVAQRLHHQVAAEGAGRQEDDLTVSEMRRQRFRQIGLRERRCRRDDQLRAGHGRRDVVRDGIDSNDPAALEVL